MTTSKIKSGLPHEKLLSRVEKSKKAWKLDFHVLNIEKVKIKLKRLLFSITAEVITIEITFVRCPLNMFLVYALDGGTA